MFGSDNETMLDKSDNMIAAMAGKTGSAVYQNMPYIDYALSVGDDYIVYIKDKKKKCLKSCAQST